MAPKLKKETKTNGDKAMGFIDVIRIYPTIEEYLSIFSFSFLTTFESEVFKLGLLKLFPFDRKVSLLFKLYSQPEEVVNKNTLISVSDSMTLSLLTEI